MIRISIKEKVKGYLEEIPKGVKLLAVSKTKPISDILEAYDVGIRDFGENKVQELLSKKDELPNDIRWHLIGKLQTNKVKYIVGKVYLIHSLSSIKLLNKIERDMKVAKAENNVIKFVWISIVIGVVMIILGNVFDGNPFIDFISAALPWVLLGLMVLFAILYLNKENDN